MIRRSKAFKVAGVAKEFPEALTIEFDFLINFENLRTSIRPMTSMIGTHS